MSFFEKRREYVTKVVDPIVDALVHDLLTEMPPDPVTFSIDWMKTRAGPSPKRGLSNMSLQGKNQALRSSLKAASATVAEIGDVIRTEDKKKSKMNRSVSFGGDSDESEDDDDDVVDEIPEFTKRPQGPRQSVSAEAYGEWNKLQKKALPVHQKTPEQKTRLQDILSLSFLFSALEEEDLGIILNALEEKAFADGERIIKEGDRGDCLYVVERGSLECKKVIEGQERIVKTCMPGDVFGELALLYNCERQASVDAAGRCLCWRLDRDTFNQVVKTAHAKRTEQYDKFVQNVSLFCAMDQAERARTIECFKIARYKQGDLVVKQGDEGDRFFVVEEGQLAARKAAPGGAEKIVREYGYGEYFGELALLKDQPRAASVVVTSEKAKLVWLDRKTFNNMLGPLQDILERRAASYS